MTGGLAIGVRWDVSARDLDHSSQPVENVQDGDELLLVRLVAHVDILHHAVVGSLLAVLLLEASAANSRFGEPILIWIRRAGEDETERGIGGLLVDLDGKKENLLPERWRRVKDAVGEIPRGLVQPG